MTTESQDLGLTSHPKDGAFYVISDRQVSEKKHIYVFECMAIVQSRLLEINFQ